MIKGIVSAVVTTLIFWGGISRTDAAVYQESGGLVVMEAENTTSDLGNWERQSALTGYTGSGHLQFLGNEYLTGPVDSPLEYTFKVETAGIYALHLRAAKTNITETTIVEGVSTNIVRKDVANDCYVRVDGDYNAGPGPYDSDGNNASLAVLQSDTKYYTYTESATDNWKWEDGIGNGNGNLIPSEGFRDAIYDFKAGETYTLVVSGRSKFFRLDRIVFRHESVTESAAQSLTLPESETVPTSGYVYDATTDFPSYTNGVVPYYIDGMNDCLGIAANIVEYRDLFATAERTFDGEPGTYDVTITALREFDGECTYRFLVNGTIVGTAQNGEVTVDYDYAPQKHIFRNITIPAGATIAVESNTDTNGKIPEGTDGGTAWARGRWSEVSLSPSAFSIVNPPVGRIAYVADGNSRDPDDIGANAVVFGILKASGLSDRLVHFSHSCDLVREVDKISEADELRRQSVLHQDVADAISYFGPFNNLADYYNCRSNQTEAVANLTAAIDASTAESPLWIVEAGEPDIIGYALSNANASAIQHVHVISHHPANDDSGDFFSWQQILDFGVTEHQIGDQNVGLQVLISDGAWDWAENHSDPGIAWILGRLKYAEQDGVASFQTGKYDCSDAGMMYWWLTGANAGGNSNSTPAEIKAMLLGESAVPPPVSDVVSLVNLGTAVTWDVGSNWSDGEPAQAGKEYSIPSTGNLKSLDGTTTFPGDSLTVLAGGKFQVRAKDTLSESTTVNGLIFSGGTSFGSGPKLAAGTGNDLANVLDGSVTNSGYTRFITYHAYSGGTLSRSLKILATIDGDGAIQAWEGSSNYGGENLIIDNAANTFSGTWSVGADSTLIFNNAGAVGSADIEVLDTGKLQILGDWDQSADLTVADTATTSVDLGSYNWTVGSLVFGSVSATKGTYTAAQLNAMGAHAVFTGSGTIVVNPQAVVAGWGTWDNASAPSPSVVLPGVTASAVTTYENKAWHTSDERGSSNDGTWGSLSDIAVASTNVAVGECMELPNATSGGDMTYTIQNNGTEDIVLSAFHFDALAFRNKAPRTYELSVLPGGGITDGVIFTSASQVITSLNAVPTSYDLHDEFDHDLTGLADHTLSPGESAQLRLAFSGGANDGSGGHDLWVDNVAVSRVLAAAPVEPPVIESSMIGGELVISWSESGFKVQSRTNLIEGIWMDVPGGDVSPVNLTPVDDTTFYRVIEQ